MHVDDWDMAIPDFESDNDFMAFIARAKRESLYDTGVDVDADDQIITLGCVSKVGTMKELSYFPAKRIGNQKDNAVTMSNIWLFDHRGGCYGKTF